MQEGRSWIAGSEESGAPMSHTMVSVQALEAGWIVECLQCERRAVISHAALLEGKLDQIETVLAAGDESASHAWSTRPDLRVGFA